MHNHHNEPVLAYDQQKVLVVLMNGSDMTAEEAWEFHEFNQLGAYMGPGSPCYIDTATFSLITAVELHDGTDGTGPAGTDTGADGTDQPEVP